MENTIPFIKTQQLNWSERLVSNIKYHFQHQLVHLDVILEHVKWGADNTWKYKTTLYITFFIYKYSVGKSKSVCLYESPYFLKVYRLAYAHFILYWQSLQICQLFRICHLMLPSKELPEKTAALCLDWLQRKSDI